jgi:hypothetical protein
MGGQNNTTTTTQAPTDPTVTSTVDQLLGGVQSAYSAGPQTFQSSLYSPTGATTAGAESGMLSASNNPAYSGAVQGGINFDSSLASGGGGVGDPTYQALRSKNANDAQTLVNGQFNNSGRFGGGSNAIAVGTGVTNALDQMDYQQYQQGIQNAFTAQNQLPGLYNSSLAPSATQGSVGAAQDANAQGILTGSADLFNRNANAKTDLLAKLTSILGGNAQTSGSTATTSSPATPWWQSALAIGGALL